MNSPAPIFLPQNLSSWGPRANPLSIATVADAATAKNHSPFAIHATHGIPRKSRDPCPFAVIPPQAMDAHQAARLSVHLHGAANSPLGKRGVPPLRKGHET